MAALWRSACRKGAESPSFQPASPPQGLPGTLCLARIAEESRGGLVRAVRFPQSSQENYSQRILPPWTLLLFVRQQLEVLLLGQVRFRGAVTFFSKLEVCHFNKKPFFHSVAIGVEKDKNLTLRILLRSWNAISFFLLTCVMNAPKFLLSAHKSFLTTFSFSEG